MNPRLLSSWPSETGAIVGALIAAWDGWRGNMYRLAVDKGHRREGIGLALTRAGENYTGAAPVG